MPSSSVALWVAGSRSHSRPSISASVRAGSSQVSTATRRAGDRRERHAQLHDRACQKHDLCDAREHLAIGEDLGPPTSREIPFTSGAWAQASSSSTMSRPSIGAVLFVCQAGRVSTGSRSSSLTSRRSERDRAPMTIEERNATEPGTAPAGSARPRRGCASRPRARDRGAAAHPDRRCVESPAALADAAKFSAERRSRSGKPVGLCRRGPGLPASTLSIEWTES